MLKYRVGCFVKAALDGEVNVICDQRNCRGLMKSGAALAVAEAFPSHAERDALMGNNLGERLLGGIVYDRLKDIHIFGLYGQVEPLRFPRQTNYGALASALMLMQEDLINWYGNCKGEAVIGMPKLGSGLASGGNQKEVWSVVSELVEFILKDYDVTIYVLNESEIPEGYQRV